MNNSLAYRILAEVDDGGRFNYAPSHDAPFEIFIGDMAIGYAIDLSSAQRMCCAANALIDLDMIRGEQAAKDAADV